MTTTDRRDFLRVLSGITAMAALPQSISRPMPLPANHRTGTIADVEHIVVLTQENRSFDHYFGSLKGVRGFGDPRAVKLPNGDSVWYQPTASVGYVLPYRPDVPNLGMEFLQDVDHGWTSTHDTWNEGKND